MGNALSSGIMPPPAPNPDNHQKPGNPSQPLATQSAGAPTGAQPQIPPPSYGQTVAALRHFGAMQRELTTVLKSPETGKSDVRPMLIDLATGLVSKGMTTPAQAVKQLAELPDRPFEQKQFLENALAQIFKAENIVLDHHRAGYAGTAVGEHEQYDDGNHAEIVNGLIPHYGGKHG